MKKLLVLILYLILLVGCRNMNDINIVIDDNNTYIYAIDYEDKKIKKVPIDYKINDYNDVFRIYTIYQNRLPMGYYIDANSNVQLLKSYVEDNNVYYVVDKYIYLTDNIDLFVQILSLSNNLLGYNKTFIICGNKTFGI